MTKGQRIRLYLAGFIIGCVGVYLMLFRGTDRTYWLPNNRVKEQVNKSTFSFSEHAKCIMDCKQITEEEVREVLKNGDVNFSESDTRGVPCPSYAIEGTSHNKRLRVLLTVFERDSTAEITTAINMETGKDTPMNAGQACKCK